MIWVDWVACVLMGRRLIGLRAYPNWSGRQLCVPKTGFCNIGDEGRQGQAWM
jgi:hypothetical protein